MRRGLMVLCPHVQLGKAIVPILIVLQHPRAACGQVSYAFADAASLPRLGLTINWLGISEVVSLNPSNW